MNHLRRRPLGRRCWALRWRITALRLLLLSVLLLLLRMIFLRLFFLRLFLRHQRYSAREYAS
jgi:hypothetical protein